MKLFPKKRKNAEKILYCTIRIQMSSNNNHDNNSIVRGE